MIWLGTSSIEFANFVKLFSLPSLRVLYLSDFVFDEACGSDGDDDIIPHIPIELSQKSGVKNLTLTLACVESGPLRSLRSGLWLKTYQRNPSWSHHNPSPGRFHDLLYPTGIH
jgi:hypothetical protein